MKKLLLALVVTCVLSGVALAGDIDYPKAPPPPETLIAKIVRLITG